MGRYKALNKERAIEKTDSDLVNLQIRNQLQLFIERLMQKRTFDL
jgi:hypothetical protein